MIRCYVVCEGQTEETFVRDVIAPRLDNQNIDLRAFLISTSPGHKGGALTYERVKKFIIHTLKGDTAAFVTTFFDLYALDNQFPHFADSQKKADVYEKVESLEQSFKADIIQENSSFASKFFPYIQPYEFEGLLFSDIAKLTQIETAWSQTTNSLQIIRNSVETPEHINDSPQTAPSKRLENHLKNPSYRKTLHGTLAIEAIGIDKLLDECRHFKQWYHQLLALSDEHSKQQSK
jgi:hypothetical protein